MQYIVLTDNSERSAMTSVPNYQFDLLDNSFNFLFLKMMFMIPTQELVSCSINIF